VLTRTRAGFSISYFSFVVSLCLFPCVLSANSAPSDINASNLTISENSAIGTVIGEFNATDPDGDGNFTYSLLPPLPSDLNLSLWLDASDASTITHSNGSVSQWADKSGNAFHFTQTTAANQPTTGSVTIGGINAINFDGSDRMANSDISMNGTHSIFAVALSNANGYGRILENDANLFFGIGNGNNNFATFYGSGSGWNEVNTNTPGQSLATPSIIGVTNDGSTAKPYVNATAQDTKNGTMQSFISLRLGAWSTGSQAWNGPVAEVLIFSTKLSDQERQSVEGYLAHKWGLQSNLPSEHPAKTFSVDANGTLTANQTFDYETDDRNYTITVRATDDHNASFDKNFTISVTNVVEDLDGDGTEDHYDLDIDGDGLSNADELAYNSDPWDASSINSPPSDINASNLTIAENSAIGTVIGEFNATDPEGDTNITYSLPSRPILSSLGKLQVWLDASESEQLSTSLTDSNPPTSGNQIKKWFDLSGNGHHAESLAGTPTWSANSFNSKPGVVLNKASLVLNNSRTTFDGWSELTLIAAFYQPGERNFATLFGKSNFSGWMDTTKDLAWSVFTHRLDNIHNIWGPAVISEQPAYTYLNTGDKSFQKNRGGSPGIMSFSYEFGKVVLRVNGKILNSSNNLKGSIQSKPELDVTIGGNSNQFLDSDYRDGGYTNIGGVNHLVISEFMIFNDSLSFDNSEKVEGYLAHKWNIESQLPIDHGYKIDQPFHRNHLFTLDENGTLKSASVFDYESQSSQTILVQATDDLNASSSQTFIVQITNVVEDLDGDGTEDYYDLDIDGDGVSNANEILYSSDPLDAGSTNSPPFSFSSSSLTVAENSSIGTVVGEFNGTSSNSDDNFTFRILPDAPDGFSPLLWLDAADPFTLYSEVNRTNYALSGTVAGWADKSGRGQHFGQSTSVSRPSTGTRIFNGLNVLDFNGSQWMKSNGDFATGTDFSIYMFAKIDVINHINDSLFCLTTNDPDFQIDAGHSNQFLARYHESGMGGAKTFATTAQHNAAVWSIVFNGYRNKKVNISVNGIPLSSATDYSTGPKQSTNSLNVFSNRSQSSFPEGFVGEFIVVNNLDYPGGGGVQAYLQKKWLGETFENDAFVLGTNGTLLTNRLLDFEADEQNQTLKVIASTGTKQSVPQEFTVSITGVEEDLDGDGVEDFHDSDSDGDGLSNLQEFLGRSDPLNSSSSNAAPSEINATTSLSFSESLALGAIAVDFNATDTNSDANLIYRVQPKIDISSIPGISGWFDASDMDSLITDLSGNNVLSWSNKSNNAVKLEVHSKPPSVGAQINGLHALFFDKNESLISMSGNRHWNPWTRDGSLNGEFKDGAFFIVVRYLEHGRFSLPNLGNFWSGTFPWTNGDFHWDIWRNAEVNRIWGPLTGIDENLLLTLNHSVTNSVRYFSKNGSIISSGDPVISNNYGPIIFPNINNEPSYIVGETIFVREFLNEADRAKIEGYLTHKWSLSDQLPSDHPYAGIDFTIDENGSLRTAREFDYETDDHNYSVRIWATDEHNATTYNDFTVVLNNVVEDLDGDGTEDHYDLDIDGDGLSNTDELLYNSDPWDASSSNRPPSDINASNLTIAENSAIGTVIGEFNATDPDGEGNFTFSVKSVFADPSNISGLNAWFDASDLSTIVTQEGSNDVVTWANKLDASVKMHGSSQKPNTGASINGLNALNFDFNSSGYERMFAYKNLTNPWSAASMDGNVSGTYQDVAVFILYQIDHYYPNAMPFGLGWNGHFSWGSNGGGGGVGTVGSFYLDTPSRISTDLSSAGATQVVSINYSNTESERAIYHNGILKSISSNVSVRDAEQFNFPNSHHPDITPNPWGKADYTLGEILVVNEVISGEDRQKIEGYLASKWGLADQLPDSHLYSPNNLFSFDGNGSLRTNRLLDYEVDEHNYTVSVEVLDDLNASYYEDFNITLTNVVEDLDGDGAEDHNDDDIDGDGLTNAEELLYNSDPRDANSRNRSPSDINASNLSIAENSAIGTVIGEFNATDPDGDTNISFTLAPPLPLDLNLSLWLDASDSTTIKESNGAVSGWSDKSGKDNHFGQYTLSAQPKSGQRTLNGLSVVDFNGSYWMKTNDVFATGDSFTFFIVSGVDTVSNVSDSMLSLSARPGFEFQAGSSNQFIVRIKKHWVGGNKWFWAWKNFTSAPKHNPAIWELSFDSGDKKRGSVYHNGNSLGTVDYQENHIPNQTSNILKLFTTRTTPHYGVDGFLAELLFVPYLPDDDEKSGIESYLAHKWGLVSNLRSDHPSRMFSIDANGSLTSNKVFDYEVDDRNYTITVRAIDDHNASFDKNFTVTVANMVEDLDSDGTEDHYDLDIDGDGLSNADELLYNSDPWDASSSNRPPSDINASNLTIAENSAIGTVIGEFNATDPDGEGNFTYAMHFDSLAIWLPFDETNGTTTQNYGSFFTNVSLLNGASFSSSEKRFGSSSLRVPISSPNARVELSTPIALGNAGASNPYSVSAWFKGLYAFSETVHGWRTLIRGSTSNHHIIINKESDEIGIHRDAWFGSGKILSPISSESNWQHLVATFDGSKTSFYIDGNLLGSVQKSPGLDIKSVGNYWGGNQHFAEYLDDFRVYSKVLSGNEISSLYHFSMDQNGTLTANQTFDYETDDLNYTISVRAFDDYNATFDKNFTITVTNVVEDLDGDGIEDHNDTDIDGDGFSNANEIAYGSNPLDPNSVANAAPNSLELNGTTILENQPAGTRVGQLRATDPDGNVSLNFRFAEGVGARDNALFAIDQNNTIRTTQAFDYETDEHNFSIRVRVADEHNFSLEKTFVIQLLNVVEDNDGDGTEDHYDPDDDNDGFSDAEELAYGSDPMDENSVANSPPHSLLLGKASIYENEPAGTIVGKVSGTDPDGQVSLTFARAQGQGSRDNNLFYIGPYNNLRSKESFDYERNQTFSIRLKVTDEHNASVERPFLVKIVNVIEDNDADGEEDHYDPDDDNDGFSDEEEIAYGSDPRDANSVVNQPPSDLLMDGGEVAENQEIGNLVARFIGVDADKEDTLRYKLNGQENNSSLPFRLSPAGNLKTSRVLDYETDEHNYTITVQATDDLNTSFQKEFMIRLTNIVEDMDGDGTEDAYDEDRDGDGYTNKDEVNVGTDPNDQYSHSNKPILKTRETVLNEDGSIDLTGGILEDGNGKITDFGFVLSSSISIDPKRSKVLWIRGVGEPEQFKLKLTQSPYQPILYFRAWAKNIAGYGIGPVRKVRIPEAPKPWWGKVAERAGGWKTSDWFGNFMSYEKGWLYHARLGWLYSSPVSESSVWLWKDKRGWLWTKEEVYPYMWSDQTGNWIYIYPGEIGEPLKFFDYSTQSYR
jgi:hypothetical protein